MIFFKILNLTYEFVDLDRSLWISDGALNVIVDELDFIRTFFARIFYPAFAAFPSGIFQIERIFWDRDSFVAFEASDSAEVRTHLGSVLATVALAQEHELILDLLTSEKN